MKNNGCAVERNISATLTTTTSVVTVTQGSSNYPNLAIDASGVNATPFQIQTSNSFECGTSIEFNLNLTYTGGSHSQCQRAPVATMASFRRLRLQPLISRRLTGSDATVSRYCPAKVALAVGLLGPNYKTYQFTNNSAAPACVTVTINAALEGQGDIESAAYLNSYNPANLCQNYLGDSGVVGLGTTVPNASYSFTVPANWDLVVVVNTTDTTTSSLFTGTFLGFFDTTPGCWTLSGTIAMRNSPFLGGESLRGSIFEPRRDRAVSKRQSTDVIPVVSFCGKRLAGPLPML